MLVDDVSLKMAQGTVDVASLLLVIDTSKEIDLCGIKNGKYLLLQFPR